MYQAVQYQTKLTLNERIHDVPSRLISKPVDFELKMCNKIDVQTDFKSYFRFFQNFDVTLTFFLPFLRFRIQL